MADRWDSAWRLRILSRIEALIVQDAVAHNEGLGANWKTRREFWADRARTRERYAQTCSRWPRRVLAMSETIRMWEATTPIYGRTNSYFLNQPGQAEIQSDLFYDYRTNVDSYPKWQAWMRQTQPRLLVIWGKYELSFDFRRAGALPTGCAES